MSHYIIERELKLKYPILAVTRALIEDPSTQTIPGCVYKLLDQAAKERVILTEKNVTCPGSARGCGFVDGVPNIPGGFDYFIAGGRGDGFPSGERIKCSPELAKRMLLGQPQNVMEGYNAIIVEPYREGLTPDHLLFLVTPDQLSGLLTLYYYRSETQDGVMVPICSGCAQLFRLPFGELRKQTPKAVLGNTDFFSRPHLDQDLLSLAVPFSAFEQMCADAAECCFFAPAWDGVKKRL